MISYIFYYNLILQTVIASVLVVSKVDDHYAISRVSDDARFWGWSAVSYMMLTMPLGMLLARFVFSRNNSVKSLLFEYTKSKIDLKFLGGKSLKYTVWLFTVISVLACLYTFYTIGYFPFYKIFKVSFSYANELRITASRDFGGNIYVRNFFALTMMPVLSYVWCFYYIRTRSVLDLIVFMGSFIFSLSILYYDFSKAPMLSYLLSFIFVYFYAFGRVNKKLGFMAVTTVVIILSLMYSFIGLTLSGLLSHNTGPIGRILLGQSAGLYFMFDIFPLEHSFLGFSSFSQLLSNVFGFEYIDRAARITMTSFNPTGVAEGTAGVMNSIYLAEAWANFGLLGVLLSPLWVGFVIQCLYLFFLKSNKNPLYLAFFVAFSSGGGITGGINEYIYNPGLIIILMFFLAVVFTSKFLNGLK